MADSHQALTEDSVQASMRIQSEHQKRRRYVYGGAALVLTVVLIIVIVVATSSGDGSSSSPSSSNTWPMVVATWARTEVVDAAWQSMETSTTPYKSLDAVVSGAQYCQTHCNVNADGVRNANVDSEGAVTQSAMVIFGPNMETGAVANLYDIDDAVGVARAVMIYSDHAILSGQAATKFATQNGFARTNLVNISRAEEKYAAWLASDCQDGKYWRNVENGQDCGLINGSYAQDTESDVHDITGCDGNETDAVSFEATSMSTAAAALDGGMVVGSISVIAIDENGEMSLSTSSNELNAKIAGRVGDAAVPGAGGFIDPGVGGCTATGDGDIIIRFSPSRAAVTHMKYWATPTEAAAAAVEEIDRKSVV